MPKPRPRDSSHPSKGVRPPGESGGRDEFGGEERRGVRRSRKRPAPPPLSPESLLPPSVDNVPRSERPSRWWAGPRRAHGLSEARIGRIVARPTSGIPLAPALIFISAPQAGCGVPPPPSPLPSPPIYRPALRRSNVQSVFRGKGGAGAPSRRKRRPLFRPAAAGSLPFCSFFVCRPRQASSSQHPCPISLPRRMATLADLERPVISSPHPLPRLCSLS